MVCTGCRDGKALNFQFSMAFQPIVELETMQPYAYEALIRGLEGQGAFEMLSKVTDENRYAFDQQCRVRAIELAARAGILRTPAKLSINFLPNAVYSPVACIQLTLKTARALDFPADRLVFEFTENEQMMDPAHVANIIASYRQMGFGTALDDFGAGHAGLNLLARFQPDTVKLDMELIRGIDTSLSRRMIVKGIVAMCEGMGLRLLAEGVETEAELSALRDLGIRYAQGYLFARPGFELLPRIAGADAPAARAA
ncbi:MAG TPA: EAL domain-containing protein [Allosphingosinicella sp.]|jgi:EAL domain-containing protein (putative c-di-GMP-specific phosphodiesterase class I)